MATPWMVIGMIGSFLFILIQLILIVDLAYALNEYFLEKYEENDHKGWYCCKYCYMCLHRVIQFTFLTVCAGFQVCSGSPLSSTASLSLDLD